MDKYQATSTAQFQPSWALFSALEVRHALLRCGPLHVLQILSLSMSFHFYDHAYIWKGSIYIDLVLEVAPWTEALESNKNQNKKTKKSRPISTNLSFFKLCVRQAELKQVSFLKQTTYTDITVHFLFFFSCSFDTEGDTSNPIWRAFWKVCMVNSDKFV